MLRHPVDNISTTKRQNIVSTRFFGINRSINGNKRCNASIKKGHCYILPKCARSLVNIGFDSQTVVQTTIDILKIAAFVIRSDMTHVNGRYIDTETSVD